MSEYLQKIIYLTQAQYDTLKTNGTVGAYTGINDNYLYFITDEAMSASDLSEDFVLPVTKGGTGKTQVTSGSLLIGNGTSTLNEIAATSVNTSNTIIKRDSSGNFSAGTITASLAGNANTATSAGALIHKTLTTTTVNNTSGSYAFSIAATTGMSQITTSSTDYVGLQIGDSVDKWQLTATGNSLFFRQNDNGGANTSWNAWTKILNNSTTSAGTNNAATLTWDTTYTIAKIDNTDIKFTTMEKPTYAFSDLTAHPTTLSGYGITDAKIASGTITLGSNTISPVTAVNWDSTNKKLTRTINGTAADVVTAATLRTDLGLSNALHFIGITSTALADGSTTSTLTAKSTNSLTKTTGFVDGDVVMDGNQLREYVWSGSAWRLLGITTSAEYTQPASTATNTWIAQVSQGTDGKITATTGSLNTSGTWSGKATTSGTADKIKDLTTTDKASSSNDWRRVWISYANKIEGRPAYTDNLVYQTSSNTLKTPHLLIEHVSGGQAEMHITYSTTIDYWWGVGTGNENHGLYDVKANKWILSAGSANTWSFVGNADTATTATNLSAAPTITSGGTSTVDLSANTAYTLTVGGKSVVFKTPADNNTATATDDILEGSNSGTAITYKPYTAQQNKLSFDTSTTNPTLTGRLNLNGYLHATKLYSGNNEVLTIQTKSKALSSAGWYRILDCTAYSMAFFITFYGGYNNQPPTPVTFLVSHAYNTTRIEQIGRSGYIGWIQQLRAVHHDTSKFYIDVYYAGSKGNTCAFEITPLDPNARSNITLIDFTAITGSITANASCETTLESHADIADTATSAGKWTTARTLTIGNKGQSVDGSENVSWTLEEIGAAPAVTGGYLPLSGGTMTGQIVLASNGFKTNSVNGYQLDSYGNFTHLRATTSDYFHFNNSAGTSKVSIYWETGNVTAAGTVTAAGFNGDLTGNADTATAANLTSTANAVAYYTDTAGTFGSKASANGALYATSANGALQWGTLPIAQGGTGVTSFTKNQVILSDNTNGTTGLTSRAYSDSASAGALSSSSTNFVTERDVYFGLPTLNNAHNYSSSSTYYAPTAGGTAGHVLIGAGTTAAPVWYGGTVMSGTAAADWETAFNGTADAFSSTIAAVTIAGGLGIAKNIIVGETATITSDTRSPNFTLTVDNADKAYLQYNINDDSIDFIFI